ncbi:hypothetical protein F4778DRAFT_55206 [Xylariomycetidae sp. FL2044]|nr:hypothetical protein F4778DRAFT_55206 [Xylariomycetidae sp. FL2044]
MGMNGKLQKASYLLISMIPRLIVIMVLISITWTDYGHIQPLARENLGNVLDISPVRAGLRRYLRVWLCRQFNTEIFWCLRLSASPTPPEVMKC